MKIILTKTEQTCLKEYIDWKVRVPCNQCGSDPSSCNSDNWVCPMLQNHNDAFRGNIVKGHDLYYRYMKELESYVSAYENVQKLKIELEDATDKYNGLVINNGLYEIVDDD